MIGKSCDVGRDRDKTKPHGDSSNVVGSESSPSSTTRRRQQQTRPPKKKRNKISTASAPTPTFPLPSGPDPTWPPAQVVVPSPKSQLPSQDSYIHGAPIDNGKGTVESVRSRIVRGSCMSDVVEGFLFLVDRRRHKYNNNYDKATTTTG